MQAKPRQPDAETPDAGIVAQVQAEAASLDALHGHLTPQEIIARSVERFDGGIAAVSSFGADSAVLARVAEIQRDNGGTVRIVAHAAQDRDNFDVSRRRALGVAQELRRLGVPTSQMVAEAASDLEPIYQTSTPRPRRQPARRSLNRLLGAEGRTKWTTLNSTA